MKLAWLVLCLLAVYIGASRPPTPAPTPNPTPSPPAPTTEPTKPTPRPTREPTAKPTTRVPTTKKPTNEPTPEPTVEPTTSRPTKPTRSPTRTPTAPVTQRPTLAPTPAPTEITVYSTVFVGVVSAMGSSSAVVWGTILQKLSHIRNSKLDIHSKRPMYCRKLYWLSVLLLVVVPIPLNLFALRSEASQQVIAPLGAALLLLNGQIFSPLLLQETVTRIDILATAVIGLGVSAIAYSGRMHPENLSDDDFLRLFARPAFIVFQFLSVCILVAGSVLIRRMPYLLTALDTNPRPGTGSQSGLCAICRRRLFLGWALDKWAAGLLPALFALVAGVASAQQDMFVKAVMDLTWTSTANQSNQFSNAVPYFLIATTLFFDVVQVYHLSQAIAQFDVVFFLPLYFAVAVLARSFNYIAMFSTSNADLLSVVFYIVGIFLIVVGALILTRRRSAPSQHALIPQLVLEETSALSMTELDKMEGRSSKSGGGSSGLVLDGGLPTEDALFTINDEFVDEDTLLLSSEFEDSHVVPRGT